MKLNRKITLAAFLAFIAVSQIALPLMGRQNLIPFAVWNMFSRSAVHKFYYDFEMTLGGETQFLSGNSNFPPGTWELVDDFGHGDDVEQREAQIAEMASRAKLLGYVPRAIVQIRTLFPEYILLTNAEKKEKVEVIYQF